MPKMYFPYRKQETDVYCAPAIVQMILAAQGTEVLQSELAQAMGTDEQGTSVAAMERFLASYGFEVARKNDAAWEDIVAAFAADSTVVVGYIEPEEEKAHYSIVSSIDDDMIHLIDPWYGPDHMLAREEFIERWRDDEDGAYGQRMMMIVSTPE
jgi:ABC-type bacteriocin/lantibiotic exporter with double-glycine peptidase domain